MRTAGELLQEARLKKKQSIQEIADAIKVKQDYLEALEKDNFEALPSATFTKGFLRKYASRLGVNPDTVVAMFRRDFTENTQGQIVPKELTEPVGKKRWALPFNVIAAAIAITSFVVFLGLQLYKFYSLPPLEVLQPVQGEVYAAKITVKGKTDPDNVVTVNNQAVVIGPNGDFSLDLTFTAGTHAIIVQATNRQGKSRLVQRTFQVTK